MNTTPGEASNVLRKILRIRSWARLKGSLNLNSMTLPDPRDRHVAAWLFICCGLVFCMVVLGGVTRLTGSGLSMVDWRPLMGWLPPLTAEDWQRTFEMYQQSPEYQKVNSFMDVEDFKGIFWLEYLHCWAV